MIAAGIAQMQQRDFGRVVREPTFVLGPIVGVWLLGSLAVGCKRVVERLYYSLIALYFVILIALTLLPLSVLTVEVSRFVSLSIWVAASVLSGIVLVRHLRAAERGTKLE